MSKFLVFTESHNGKIKRSSQELLQFAAKSGSPVVSLILDPAAEALGLEAAHHGATEVLFSKDADFESYNPEVFTTALVEAIQKSGASTVLASSSSTGKDLFPRVAARIKAGVVSDGIEIQASGDDLKVKKPFYAGKCFATATFENTAVKMVLMRPNQLPVMAGDATKTASQSELSFTKPSLKTLIKAIVKGTSEKLDLTEANIIVAGGRGLKEASNFKILNDLADVLGATVGASRAVVDAGWVGHSMQVGQTGKTVAPSLYIAVGLSGAIQHLAGMSGSKVIVAINSDPNAPIFQKATYGLVGDAFEIVPLLAAEFKKVLQH
ncbi:MAG: electron transfer flavoprotein subunit alpha [Bdellovibrionales bacterium RIFCSPHIGHO2_01_FULL_40_29]|nr:MAG: electron transfer flavoprotein subunit alpha [Bdellovibrionales bacterium RIFCSPHIGHO2_01_FULL_40_29]OFZ34667.1 MAG: electron transfer flavoprotein subunit alpha [Bdellovibrionales bacterium RIFCSPHIGHO2_02_FULL_40_15]